MLKPGSERRSQRSLLVFLRFGIDVSEDDDVGKVDPEAAEQRGHPGAMNKGWAQQKRPGYSASAFSRDYHPRWLHSRSAVVIDAVDLATDKDPDPAVAPFASVGQQEGDEQSQTCGCKTHA